MSPEESLPRFVVGIDLGTTNSALSFVDTSAADWQVQTFPILQVVAPGEVAPREILPSFTYFPAAHEFTAGAVNLPWDQEPAKQVVGVFAREQGKLVPGRVVESAKSWLCHSGVDRTSALLPWRGAEDVPRQSPVEISAGYLRHLRLAWNHAHPEFPLEEQDVVITLPASFDQVARELTVEAAKRAGLPRVFLIEEPQAAFYSWLHQHARNWPEIVHLGQNILVCDVGGGTTDFTLIRVREQSGQIQFQRIAVGDHLILGGDNLDLALAHHLEPQFANGRQLEPRQWGSLVRVCRQIKEELLSSVSPAAVSATIPGSGSRLVGGSLTQEVTRDTVQTVLLEGFFPPVKLDEQPQRQRSGFQEFGLPYATDPAVTRHLASFLRHQLPSADQEANGNPARPDIVLFNGGVFLSDLIQQRIIDVIINWYAGESSDWKPLVLENPRHDLAVSRGAAYYGMVRRDRGIRISAGLPRTYYIGVDGTSGNNGDGQTAPTESMRALCVLPAGIEPGTTVDLPDRVFSLTVATPVEFPLFHSSLRLTDPVGALIPIEREQLTPLPPIRTVLRFKKEKQAATLRVRLQARLTEIGTMQVWCHEVDGSRSWQLQFDVRAATQTDQSGHLGEGEAAGVLDEETVNEVRQLLHDTFGPNGKERPGGVVRRISTLLDLSREKWPPAFLRQLWETLIQLESGRKKSAEHESRWLNLLGFSLRPGYGLALDDSRVAETWKLLRGRLLHPGPAMLNEWGVLWRRLSGGLTGGQQQALANPLLTSIREEQRRARSSSARKRVPAGQESAESWRLLGSLERLPSAWKHEIGQRAIELLEQGDSPALEPALLWALQRLGARDPVYGPLNEVVDAEVVSQWLREVTRSRNPTSLHFLAVMQMSRLTGDRYRDLSPEDRERAANWISAHGGPDDYVTLIREGGSLAAETSNQILGDALPVGLRLH